MRAKTKTELFNELKQFGQFHLLSHRAVKESENVRELKKCLAYYFSKYTCLARQSREVKYFLGEIFYTDEKTCKSNILQLTEIAKFMGYEIDKLTW